MPAAAGLVGRRDRRAGALFEPGRVLQLIARTPRHHADGRPHPVPDARRAPRLRAAELGSLRHAVVGGAPMPAPLLRIWHRSAASRSARATADRGLAQRAVPGQRGCRAASRAAVGQAVPARRRAVADPVTGVVLEGAATGELWVRGPERLRRLPRRSRGHRRRRCAGEWLRTGDLVARDADGVHPGRRPAQGHLHLRRRERRARRGRGRAAAASARSSAAAVVGVPRRACGANAASRSWCSGPGSAVDEDEVLAHCAPQLAAFKVPVRIEMVDALPRSAIEEARRVAAARPRAGASWRRCTMSALTR